jgi:hypothetical protein
MPNDLELQQAIIALRNKDKNKARLILTKLVQINPDNDRYWYYLAFSGLGKKQALYCLRKSVSINPSNQKASDLIKKLETDLAAPNLMTPSSRQAVCRSCGGGIPIGSIFCISCGNKIESRNPEPSQRSSRIPLCVISFITGAVFAILAYYNICRQFNPLWLGVLFIGILSLVLSYLFLVTGHFEKKHKRRFDKSNLNNDGINLLGIIAFCLSILPVLWPVSFPILYYAVQSSFKPAKPSNKTALPNPKELQTAGETAYVRSRFPVISMIFGTILFVFGVLGILLRVDIMRNIVGENRRVREFLWGGNSAGDTIQTIVMICGVLIIIGIVLLFIGIGKNRKTTG